MNYETFMNLIADSKQDDWIADDERGLWVLKSDLSVSIQREDSECPDQFTEDWATQCPDPNAYIQRYFLRYGENIIETVYTASIDGRRADIPYPRLSDMTITKFQRTIGEIVNDKDSWNEYIRMKKIAVRE